VLAAEFGVMQSINRMQSPPGPTFSQLLRAWTGESLHAPRVFCWRQPFRHDRWSDYLPPDAQGRRGLVLVHGFFCNRGLWNAWMPKLRQIGCPHVAVDLEPVFGSIDDYVPIIEAAVEKIEKATGLAPVLVAHSMGGLACRRWWLDQHISRLHHVVTIGTPHRGTWLARWALSTNARQMRVGSGWLAGLGRREDDSRFARFTCFWSRCDNIVFPASTGKLTGADNRELQAVAHVRMVDHPSPMAEAMRRVQ
jgi:triacylglycerol esterase/lipase EstA (alpha/beta hydrolase family)